ncbi:MAG TPA: ABC transporter permease [Alphaproteobacteria bacterium]|nr:ABC transporter permease [Alphaproteobacteria bacterium]
MTLKRAPIVISVSEMVEHGLIGRALSPRLAFALKAASILGFLLVWTLASMVVSVSGLFNPIFLPSPWTVFGKMWQMAWARQLEVHIAATMQRVVVGFGLAAVLAVTLGLLAGRWSWLRHGLEPLVEVFRPIPPLAMLPLFIVWVGIGEASKVAFITYATFFPMFLTTIHGVLHVDPILLRAAASLGANQAQLFFRVILPAAFPEILTGLRLGVALAFFVIVISEFIGAEHGLGFLINDGRNFFLVPQMLGAAVVLGLLGYACNEILRLVEQRLLRWQQR